MILYLLNDSFEKIGIIDSYVSMIWTTRYQDVGEFELYLPAQGPNEFECGQYLQRDDDDSTMIIENITFNTDEEAGDFCTLTGRSIEQILSYRIVWDKSQLFGQAENSIYRLVDENMINANIAERNIPNLKCAKAKGFEGSGNFVYNGETLLEIIVSMCQIYDFGFKISNTNNTFVFEIYKGSNRSYSQNINPYVIFSPDFDNLTRTKYVNEIKNHKNVCLVYGESEIGYSKVTVGEASGLSRHETFTDAGNTNSSLVMKTKGEEVLSGTGVNETFEGEIESTYKYKEDYFLGDIIQIENEYGIKATAQITEMIENDDESGYTCIPTFKTLEV